MFICDWTSHDFMLLWVQIDYHGWQSFPITAQSSIKVGCKIRRWHSYDENLSENYNEDLTYRKRRHDFEGFVTLSGICLMNFHIYTEQESPGIVIGQRIKELRNQWTTANLYWKWVCTCFTWMK